MQTLEILQLEKLKKFVYLQWISEILYFKGLHKKKQISWILLIRRIDPF